MQPSAVKTQRPLTIHGLVDALDASPVVPDSATLISWLHRLAPSRDELKRHVQFGSDKYRRNLVCRREHFEVLVLCWRPGQHSPIHDHHGSHCAVAVISGEASELRFAEESPGRLKAQTIQSLPAGSVTASWDVDMHVLANWASPERDLITLHVYSPPLRNMRVYGDDLVRRVPMSEIARLPVPVPPHLASTAA